MENIVKAPSRETGWKPLPTSLKVLFVLEMIGLVSTPLSITSIALSGFPVFGIYIDGIFAVILYLLIMAGGTAVFIYGLWKRLSWTWLFSLIYYGYFVLNGLLSLLFLSNRLEDIVPSEELSSAVQFGAMGGAIIGLVVYVIYLIILYKNKKYFISAPKKH